MARALSRLALGRGGPRDLACLRDGLRAGEQVSALAVRPPNPLETPPFEVAQALEIATPGLQPNLAALLEELTAGLGPDLPMLTRDGGFVAPGVRPELDQTRALRDDSRRVIAGLELRLAAETGVPLKIRHNAVLGYFLETSALKAEPLLKPPLSATFIHRQTLASQTRFTTVELADLDVKIAAAADRALAIEVETFEAWRAMALACAAAIQAAVIFAVAATIAVNMAAGPWTVGW